MKSFVALSLVAVWFCGVAGAQSEGPRAVSALGRLEPQHGIITVSASSTPEALSGGVLKSLNVEVGDNVKAGQLLAVTDTAPVLEARLKEAKSLLELVRQQAAAGKISADATCVRAGVLRREADRLRQLRGQNLASEDETDRAMGAAEAAEADCAAARIAAEVGDAEVVVAEARLRRAEQELQRAYVYAPMDGRVLAINARPGERIDTDGILELGRVDRMYAIAEVYETDVSRLSVGQGATIESSAIAGAVKGSIERIRPLVRKQDQIGTDPAARKDARVVEVEVLLDAPRTVADYTNMQVDVLFDP
ncbi:MAG: efflux RND transporter periplasmic adaptor subunit [Woeseiaceae bacterium]|nr:efflux RND transporter periplasmic adaptor subunit [Woeseiaceae bacterium]